MRRWLWPLVASALVLGGQLAWAGRADDATMAVTPFSVPHTHQGEAVAQCEPGQRATGGGVDATLGPGANNRAGYWIQFSEPLDAQGVTDSTGTGDEAIQWHAAVDNHATGDSEDFDLIALCSESTDARIVARRFHLGPHHTLRARLSPAHPASGLWVAELGSWGARSTNPTFTSC